MVAMSLLGGMGASGSCIGSDNFILLKQPGRICWVYNGLYILIINIVYFQQGIMGWLRVK